MRTPGRQRRAARSPPSCSSFVCTSSSELEGEKTRLARTRWVVPTIPVNHFTPTRFTICSPITGRVLSLVLALLSLRTTKLRHSFKESSKNLHNSFHIQEISSSFTVTVMDSRMHRRKSSKEDALVDANAGQSSAHVEFPVHPEPNGVDGRTPESSRVRVNSVPSPSYHRSEGPPPRDLIALRSQFQITTSLHHLSDQRSRTRVHFLVLPSRPRQKFQLLQSSIAHFRNVASLAMETRLLKVQILPLLFLSSHTLMVLLQAQPRHGDIPESIPETCLSSFLGQGRCLRLLSQKMNRRIRVRKTQLP